MSDDPYAKHGLLPNRAGEYERRVREAKERAEATEAERDRWRERAHAAMENAKAEQRERQRWVERYETAASHLDNSLHTANHNADVIEQLGKANAELAEERDRLRAVVEAAGPLFENLRQARFWKPTWWKIMAEVEGAHIDAIADALAALDAPEPKA